MIGKCAVEIASDGAMERVGDQGRFGFAQGIEVDELFETLQIVFAQVDYFAVRRVRCAVGERRNATIHGEVRGARFDILGDSRQSGAGVGGGKFQTVILRGILASSEVFSTIQLTGHDFEGNRGGGSELLPEQRSYAVV